MTFEQGAIAVKTPYIPLLVQAIKSLPYTERRYEPTNRVWLVDPKHGDKVASWIELYAGEKVFIPSFPITSNNSKQTVQVIYLKYIGSCKKRDDGSVSAFGLVSDDWKVIFSENVLRMWFEGIEIEDITSNIKRQKTSTLYEVLGIKHSVSDGEVQKAFRRMAMQWHPDHCKEPDAAEMFMKIKEAYDVLKDSNKRKRYNKGLLLEAQQVKIENKKEEQPLELLTGYRSPLRCGVLMVEGELKLGRIVVEKIHAWEDWVENGKTLVSSWSTEENQLVEEWI
mgnify:CR=1 FL=1